MRLLGGDLGSSYAKEMTTNGAYWYIGRFFSKKKIYRCTNTPVDNLQKKTRLHNKEFETNHVCLHQLKVQRRRWENIN
jgi:hypothetical protein